MYGNAEYVMKISQFLVGLLLGSLAPFSFASAKDKLPEPKLDETVNSVYPAIVRIEVVSEKGSGGRMMKARSTGSGVIISKDGLVVTNHHVAGKATRLTCRLHDGEELSADLLGADPMTDLAVIRLRTQERPPGSPPLSVAVFGNSDKVKVGDLCFAMGSPAGLSQSVTRGIIANVAMISPHSGSFRLDGENAGELVRWLGHDAVIFLVTAEVHSSTQEVKSLGLTKLGSAAWEEPFPPTWPRRFPRIGGKRFCQALLDRNGMPTGS